MVCSRWSRIFVKDFTNVSGTGRRHPGFHVKVNDCFPVSVAFWAVSAQSDDVFLYISSDGINDSNVDETLSHSACDLIVPEPVLGWSIDWGIIVQPIAQRVRILYDLGELSV